LRSVTSSGTIFAAVLCAGAAAPGEANAVVGEARGQRLQKPKSSLFRQTVVRDDDSLGGHQRAQTLDSEVVDPIPVDIHSPQGRLSGQPCPKMLASVAPGTEMRDGDVYSVYATWRLQFRQIRGKSKR